MQKESLADVIEPREGPLSALRIMDILSALAGSKGVKLGELSAALGIPRTSLLGLLRGLTKGQYVHQTEFGYVLGEETLRFCAKAYQSNNLPERARPVLKLLADKTHETIALSALAEDGKNLVYLEVIESQSALRFAPQRGDLRPLYATSPGQVLLAYLDEKKLEEYLRDTTFERFTPHTITRQELRTRIQTIRRDGYAVNFDGITRGVSSIAFPVLDSAGKLACVLSAAGPAERFSESHAQILAATDVAAAELSRMLGYMGMPTKSSRVTA
jgi:DNA-binding IclR family transcriptional regulator